MLKPRNISCVFFFLICQVICYSVIEETAHVIGKSQSMREVGARTDEEGERWWGRRGGRGGGEDKLDVKSTFSPDGDTSSGQEEINRQAMDKVNKKQSVAAAHMSPGCVDVVTHKTLIANSLSLHEALTEKLRSRWSAQGSDWVWVWACSPSLDE